LRKTCGPGCSRKHERKKLDDEIIKEIARYGAEFKERVHGRIERRGRGCGEE